MIIITLVLAVAAGIAIAYYLKLPPAVELVDGIKTQITELTSGGIDAKTLLTGGSAVATAGSLYTTYNQYKGKVAAQANAASELLQKSEAVTQVKDLSSQLTSTKDTLTAQVAEANIIKESALAEAEQAKAALAQSTVQVTKLQSQIDGLHELIPDMKDKDLTSVVKNALRIS